MTETETEVIEKKKKNKFKKIVELEEPAIKKFIIDERNSGKTWAQVVSKLKIEKNVEACGLTLQKVYEKALATSITRSPIARDQFKSMYNTVNERYEKAAKWIDRLGEIFDNLYEKVKKGEISELILLKIAPIIQNNSKEVLNQLKFIRDEQERITVQQKNLIYSPIQIIQVIHNNLKKLQEEGFITIHKPIQEIKIEDDEVKEEDKESD